MRLLAALCASLALLAAGSQARLPGAAGGDRETVVVTLASPPLAEARGDRARASARVDAEQAAFAAALRDVPGARLHWRYRLVLNGASVSLPAASVVRLRALPGVREVVPQTSYPAAAVSTGSLGRAVAHVAATRADGTGVRIGVIDDGIDQRHPFFDPRGYAMPPGFPKGQRAFTTAKVIVARSFPPPGRTAGAARLPLDEELSSHGTHVAGIAAGNADTPAGAGRRASGVAPRAYLGNYRALTVPTASGLGLNGNTPELVAAVEAAVRDGMDVINLSVGEAEVDPRSDLVARALDAAAAAGVVPVAAAGNDFGDYGRGTIGSPGTSARAITVGAVDSKNVLAGYTAAGPSAVSLRLKPDVVAPGTDILSAAPDRGWGRLSGTSMAAPHAAGIAALLLEQHPDWTVDRLKGALVGTAAPALGSNRQEAPPTRAGAGVTRADRAAQPLVVATPSSASFGAVPTGTTAGVSLALEDAGGGAGTWQVSVTVTGAPPGAGLTAPVEAQVPGTLDLTATAGQTEGELHGIVILERGGETRRIPFWARAARAQLAGAQVTALAAPGSYGGDTRSRPALVDTYRYPEAVPDGPITAELAGPEQVFRVTLPRGAANFGVVVTSREPGVTVEPRVVFAGDEDHLVGYTGLPLNHNPYLSAYGRPVLAAGAVRVQPGAYDVVFDSATAGGAGPFRFRHWVNDVTPPTVRLLTRSVRRGQPIRIALADGQSGVDPDTVSVLVNGEEREATLRGRIIRISTARLPGGSVRVSVSASDYQESRNMENVLRILPNTRTASFSVPIR